MTIRDILDWLQTAPVLQGEPLNLDYLPAYTGWSLSVPKTQMKTDILGNTSLILTLKLSRRRSPADNDDRLAALEELEALATWACTHPPDNARVQVTAPPSFRTRSPSGTEDFETELTLLR